MGSSPGSEPRQDGKAGVTRLVRGALHRAFRGEFRRGVLILATGTIIAQAVYVASAPILTRLYSPSEFGTYSVAISIVAILVTISCVSYQVAVPLPDSDVVAADVLALCLLVNLGMSAATGVLTWFVGQSLVSFAGAPELGPYVLLIALGQFGGGLVSALTYWAVRTKDFSTIAATSFTQSGTMAGVQIGLGLAGLGAPGLLVGYIAGRYSGSVRLARSAWHTHAPAFRRASRAGILAAAVRYRRFPIFSMPSSIVNTLGQQAPLLLLVTLYGPETGGQYALADRLCGLPISLLATAVGGAYFSKAALVSREEPAALRELFVGTTRSLARAALVPFVLLGVLAPPLAGFVFGADWSEVGLFVTILTPMYFIIMVTNPTSSTLDVLERQDLQLVLGLLRLGIICGAVLAATALGLPPVGAVCVLSAAGCLTYAMYGLGSWHAIGVRHAALGPVSVTEPSAGQDASGGPHP